MKTLYQNHASRSRRKNRATTMLEFAIVLPIFLFMMLFTIDMGTVILISGSVNDVTYSAARAGSQSGGAGVAVASGSVTYVCSDAGSTNRTCNRGRSYQVLESGIDAIPFGGSGDSRLFSKPSMTIVSGSRCQNASTMVVIRSDYTVNMITPGLNSMMNIIGGRDDSNFPEKGWRLSTTGVARCEIVR